MLFKKDVRDLRVKIVLTHCIAGLLFWLLLDSLWRQREAVHQTVIPLAVPFLIDAKTSETHQLCKMGKAVCHAGVAWWWTGISAKGKHVAYLQLRLLSCRKQPAMHMSAWDVSFYWVWVRQGGVDGGCWLRTRKKNKKKVPQSPFIAHWLLGNIQQNIHVRSILFLSPETKNVTDEKSCTTSTVISSIPLSIPSLKTDFYWLITGIGWCLCSGDWKEKKSVFFRQMLKAAVCCASTSLSTFI